jgi:hypothetical protein
LQFRPAQRHQSRATEAAAEQQEPGSVFALQKRQGLLEFRTRRRRITRAPSQQPKVQSWHRELLIQIHRDLVFLARGVVITAPFSAQRQQVVCSAVEFIQPQ